MSEKKKSVYELRKDLRILMEKMRVTPSKMARADVEQMINVYSKAVEVKATEPPAVHRKGGRSKPKEVESSPDEMGIVVPKKVVKEKTEYAIEKEKKAKKPAAPAHVAEDSGTGSESEEEERVAKKAVAKVSKAAVAPTPVEKPKRVLSDEQKAKMAAGRQAKKAAAGGGAETPKKAEPKKATVAVGGETPPPDAPPSAPVKKEKMIPVFKTAQ